nr:hypothetical protein [Acidimicrobiia bacterium]
MAKWRRKGDDDKPAGRDREADAAAELEAEIRRGAPTGTGTPGYARPGGTPPRYGAPPSGADYGARAPVPGRAAPVVGRDPTGDAGGYGFPDPRAGEPEMTEFAVNQLAEAIGTEDAADAVLLIDKEEIISARDRALQSFLQKRDTMRVREPGETITPTARP